MVNGVFGEVLLEADDLKSKVVTIDPSGRISAVAPLGLGVALEEAYGKDDVRSGGDSLHAVGHEVREGSALVVDGFNGESDVVGFAHAVPVAEAPDTVHVAWRAAIDILVGLFVIFEDLVDGAVFGGVVYSRAVLVEVVIQIAARELDISAVDLAAFAHVGSPVVGVGDKAVLIGAEVAPFIFDGVILRASIGAVVASVVVVGEIGVVYAARMGSHGVAAEVPETAILVGVL